MKNRNSVSSKSLRTTENNFQHQLIKSSAIIGAKLCSQFPKVNDVETIAAPQMDIGQQHAIEQ